jgi:hypothetical protein
MRRYAVILAAFLAAVVCYSAPARARSPGYAVLRGPVRGHAAGRAVYSEPYAWGWFGARGRSPATYHRGYYGDAWRFGVVW